MPGKYPHLPPDPTLVRREKISPRKLFDFKSYRDGQLVHFEVPLDTKFAIWTFRTNYTRDCTPGTVSV